MERKINIMRNYTLFLILISFAFLTKAQDIDLYKINKDDNVKSPKISSAMSFDEFQILSRNLRMKDMMYGVIVPGYVHFQAKEKKTGYVLLGLRSASYLGLGAVYFSSKSRNDKWYNNLTSTNDVNSIKISENWSIKKSDIIIAASVITIFSTYVFDWIHGQYKLQKKQNMIRYKYGIKLKLEQNLSSELNYTPTLGLSLKF